MQPEERDAAYLWDMLNAAREAHMTVEDTTCDTFMEDWLRRRALERTLEVLGEAARKVSVEFQSAHPDIDWRGLIGQRNVLAHEYDRTVIMLNEQNDHPPKHFPKFIKIDNPDAELFPNGSLMGWKHRKKEKLFLQQLYSKHIQ